MSNKDKISYQTMWYSIRQLIIRYINKEYHDDDFQMESRIEKAIQIIRKSAVDNGRKIKECPYDSTDFMIWLKKRISAIQNKDYESNSKWQYYYDIKEWDINQLISNWILAVFGEYKIKADNSSTKTDDYIIDI